ncbi:MAG: rhodanese-like domain-containing protein [Bacteroidota bacterium]
MNKTIIKLIVAFISISFIISSCSCPCEKEVSGPDEIVEQLIGGLDIITPEELKLMMDSLDVFYLVDVREMNEYAYGYIPGGINIPGGVLIFKMGNTEFWDNEMIYPPEKSDKLIVYCKKGKRSVIAADYLERLGYENVKYLEGGWKAWEMAYPLEYEENLDLLGGGSDDHGDEGGC